VVVTEGTARAMVLRPVADDDPPEEPELPQAATMETVATAASTFGVRAGRGLAGNLRTLFFGTVGSLDKGCSAKRYGVSDSLG
jgi:hypothetical protein